MPLSAESGPLANLSAAGVSVWLDDLSRELLAGGELKGLIADKNVVGVTTNPTIFASALSKGDRYNEQLRRLGDEGSSVDDAVFALTTDDVRDACDVLSPVYERTAGSDGRGSIEVDPRLAQDAEATVGAASRPTVISSPGPRSATSSRQSPCSWASRAKPPAGAPSAPSPRPTNGSPP
ncbi:transaldolase family protein [Streptomyces sp. NPDC001568]|uniref:transaldolase family protein n=1 Tax=Streptomyces sp. NPDC001568 TaxID=3364588 RepID=UPI0036747C71